VQVGERREGSGGLGSRGSHPADALLDEIASTCVCMVRSYLRAGGGEGSGALGVRGLL
jgi:hypothetical protein